MKKNMINALQANLKMINNDTYLYDIIDSYPNAAPISIYQIIENKALYLKGMDPEINEPTEEEIANFSLDTDPTLTGLFRTEAELYISSTLPYMEAWTQIALTESEIEDIVEMAAKRFDAIKCSDTYPMDVLAYQTIVSDCLKFYFDRLLAEYYSQHYDYS